MSEKRWAWFSLSRWIFWLALLLPSFLLGWIYSVAFVAVCSLYANFGTDFAAWRADRNNDLLAQLCRIESKLDQLLGGDKLDN